MDDLKIGDFIEFDGLVRGRSTECYWTTLSPGVYRVINRLGGDYIAIRHGAQIILVNMSNYPMKKVEPPLQSRPD